MSGSVSLFEYVLGDIPVWHNTERTIELVSRRLGAEGHAGPARVGSLLYDQFRTLNIRTKTLLDFQEQVDGHELDLNQLLATVMSRELPLEYDSMAVWAELAERQEQAMRASSEGANNDANISTISFDNLILQREALQKKARNFLDTFTVARSSHPAWGSSAGRDVVYTMSASTLPQDEDDFDRGWRFSLDHEQQRRKALQQETSREFLRLMTAHADSQPWSPDERSALHTCIRGLFRTYLTEFTQSADAVQAGDLEADAATSAPYGKMIVRVLALVIDNGEDNNQGLASSVAD